MQTCTIHTHTHTLITKSYNKINKTKLNYTERQTHTPKHTVWRTKYDEFQIEMEIKTVDAKNNEPKEKKID